MAGHSKISLYFPDKHLFTDKKTIVLGGDAGGTKVNLAFFEATGAGVRMVKASGYHSGSFPSVNKILQQFLVENPGYTPCLLYTSDAADEEDSVDLGGRRIIK